MIVRVPLWPDRPICLPILMRLYVNKTSAARDEVEYKTRPQLAVELLEILCQAHRTRRFHVVADSAYGGKSVLNVRPANCEITSRIRLDAQLVGPPPPRRPGTTGRPRIRGEKLPTPAAMLGGSTRTVELLVYGRTDRVRMAECEARLYAAPGTPARIVVIEALVGGRPAEAFYTTRSEQAAVDVLTTYASRWSIEVTFHDAKQSLGFEQPQGWSPRAVERTAPLAMMVYTLTVLWYVSDGHLHDRPDHFRPWYRQKSRGVVRGHARHVTSA